ncbi:alpha/beta-Hydrolases superfamily protein [Zea mays]|uniref:Alpha/beta-Hydrolases superfamily protein n=1 Tax=Zea mays TaxID=4577 RepID=A0A1D6MBA3_MAIZE|nr:alpha/beta-Hydrolases superfamily protein [Zea mays]
MLRRKQKWTSWDLLLETVALQDDSILVDLADAITKEGISAFRFDFSGNGESDGEFQYGSYRKEAADLRSVVLHFSEQKYDIIALIGHSKGGNAVLLYASKYHDVPAIVNISGRFALEREDHASRCFGGCAGELQYRVSKASLDDRLSTDTLFSSRAISEGCRVLTIHGAKDEIVPAEDARQFAANIRNHELRIVADANHRYTGHREELASLVLGFLSSHPYQITSRLRPRL